MKHWQTWWSIGGPKLAADETFLSPTIVIAPLTEEEFERAKTDFRNFPDVRPRNEENVIHFPPRDEVTSRYRLQIDVMAKNADDAAAKAQQITDRLLMSLSLVIGGARYYAELRKLRLASDITEMSAWSQMMAMRILGKAASLEQHEIERTSRIMAVIETDAVAENAYTHLLSAWRLHETSGSKPLERSILQHYVLCIEAVVDGYMTKVRRANADEIKSRERDYARQFSEELHKRADKPQAIRDAVVQLNRIGQSHILPAIETAADALCIPPVHKSQAIELYRFRSKRLSHPGRPKPSELKKWLHSKGPALALADTLARSFLERYCEWRKG